MILVSLFALMSDVTRNDVLVYASNGRAFDALPYRNPDIGSFFLIYRDEIMQGPFCKPKRERNSYDNINRKINITNKLGNILSVVSDVLPIHSTIEWQIEDISVPPSDLNAYVEGVFEEEDCDAAMKNIKWIGDTRICYVNRIWKDDNDKIIAVFFHHLPVTVNSPDGGRDHHECLQYEKDRLWTWVKIQLDLLDWSHENSIAESKA